MLPKADRLRASANATSTCSKDIGMVKLLKGLRATAIFVVVYAACAIALEWLGWGETLAACTSMVWATATALGYIVRVHRRARK